MEEGPGFREAAQHWPGGTDLPPLRAVAELANPSLHTDAYRGQLVGAEPLFPTAFKRWQQLG